ncbi:hypothetical protein PRIPAC_72882 [Pristionchus pacificus]|uniref:Uncharacterized protein n=1 Tax=Pristionchus pacificus TaxID=54126 RepID=A0A2A6C5D3_PRIPA|nr:hypothetical protein PRIPAC_72882 [Pristionchus pacificus]|eukprot:PDM73340.1 hypothetical protein PRIPAC_40696 [Pristionchus pacificus]
MPRSPLSPPGSSQSSSKQSDTKRRKKSWSLEGKKKKDQPKSRQQIKAMLLAKEKIKEEDLDAPPNSDAKDDSLRIVEQHKFMEKEEYAMKQPQIALKRKVKKKGNRRAETVRVVRKNKSRSEVPKGSREESGSATPTDTTLFKERVSDTASANNSNANSPDNSDRQREREVRRRALDIELRRRALVDRTQERTLDRSNRSTTDHSTPMDSEGDSAPLPLAREPEPEIETRRSPVVVQRSTVEKAGASRMVKLQPQQQKKLARIGSEPILGEIILRLSEIGKRLASSSAAVKSTAAGVKSTGETSTQLALEPEPDLDRVRRQKEAAFMKRFLTALKLLPNTAPPRPITPPPRSEDSPSDSSKRHPRNYKHNMHQMRKHPK